MKTHTIALVVLAFVASFLAAPRAQAQYSDPKIQAVYQAAYDAEMARLLQQQQASAPVVPLAAPKPPGEGASKDDWARYNNAVAAWNQRTAAAEKKAAADRQADAAYQASLVQQRIRENRAAAEDRAMADEDRRLAQQMERRTVEAMEAAALAQQLEVTRRLGLIKKQP